MFFFHASSEYDKSYMINRIVYFGLKATKNINIIDMKNQKISISTIKASNAKDFLNYVNHDFKLLRIFFICEIFTHIRNGEHQFVS